MTEHIFYLALWLAAVNGVFLIGFGIAWLCGCELDESTPRLRDDLKLK